MNKPIVLLPILAIASLNASCDAYIVTKPTALISRRCLRTAVTKPSSSALQSSTGGNERPPPPEGGDGDSNSQWDDFFREESENLQKAREYMSENALPLSYDGPNNDNDESSANETKERQSQDEESSSLVRSEFFQGEPNPEDLANNPYLQVVSRLSPSELISKFTSSAHPRVQNAVRSTILSLIGGLPKMMFDVTTVTTGQRLASLMFQLQITGYTFKNAEYRLSLEQSLGGFSSDSESIAGAKFLLKGDAETAHEEEEIDPLKGEVKGKIRVRYGGSDGKDQGSKDSDEEQSDNKENDSNDDSGEPPLSGVEMEVDAEAYMSELRSEVSQLRDELVTARKEKEDALRKDLLVYIRTLPEKELRDLTATMSPDVLVAMKGLVNAVMSGIGEGQIGPNTVTEQSGEALAQLCMWQLVVGYNLRTLEVREEMKKSLTAGLPGTADEPPSGADLDGGPGAFE